jgi:type II restriction/modification system DNA methylase subunit YeeA
LQDKGSPATWPNADVIIGNPPFLGGKMLRNGLGDVYVGTLFAAYKGHVPQEADLVTYWFDRANAAILGHAAVRAGLVATNSIRGGASRKVLDRILSKLVVFEAWSDEPWINQGAAVRVSLIAFGRTDKGTVARLDGVEVARIHADLTGGGVDLTTATRLKENAGVAFMGDTKGGAFDVPGKLARDWLKLPKNPNGQSNAVVVRPWVNGLDLTRRARDMWIVDFGWEGTEQEAALFEAPFGYVEREVKPERAKNKREHYRRFWWRHVEPRPGMWKALQALDTYIATPTVAKHRLFGMLPTTVCPDHQLIVIARADHTTFGILHSRFHEIWSLGMCTWLGVGNDPRYTPTTTFETYPFPAGLTPRDTAKGGPQGPRAEAIATNSRTLNVLRENWLNPPEWVDRLPESVPGYPARIIAKPGHENDLKKRTLTKLYNARPTWLDNAHKALDMAVAQAYGWADYAPEMPDEEILRRLFELNKQRA